MLLFDDYNLSFKTGLVYLPTCFTMKKKGKLFTFSLCHVVTKYIKEPPLLQINSDHNVQRANEHVSQTPKTRQVLYVTIYTHAVALFVESN